MIKLKRGESVMEQQLQMANNMKRLKIGLKKCKSVKGEKMLKVKKRRRGQDVKSEKVKKRRR